MTKIIEVDCCYDCFYLGKRDSRDTDKLFQDEYCCENVPTAGVIERKDLDKIADWCLLEEKEE